MATIQVRDVPEETYRTLRLRAKAEGKSLQAYLRDLLVELTARRTKAEAVAAIEAALAKYGGADVDPETIVAHVRADRR